MRLVDLNPKWLGAGGEGVFRRNAAGEEEAVPERHGVGIVFDCPCGRQDYDDGHTPQVCIEFAQPLDGGPPYRTDGHVWQRTGDTFETLTLSPSIQRMEPSACRWHGFVQGGEVLTC